MRLAAVDIGSNAIRFQVSNVLVYQNQTSFKKYEYLRFPLRLGEDVFNVKEISAKKEAKFMKIMEAFKLLFEIYEVDDYMICATSAMRESKNGAQIAEKVKQSIGLDINIIDGMKEADFINTVLINSLDEKTYLHIDVGGGSTELNVYAEKKKVISASFKLGSVRLLENKVDTNAWDEIRNWIETYVNPYFPAPVSIGTGGNINKVNDLSGKKDRSLIEFEEIGKIQAHINGFSQEDRINLLKLNPDRADVIVPALDIYLSIMKWANSSQMLIPDIGLKDGIIQALFDRNKHKLQLS